MFRNLGVDSYLPSLGRRDILEACIRIKSITKYFITTVVCLHILYLSLNFVRTIHSRRLILAEHVARMEEGKVSNILKGKSTGKRTFERHRWKCIITIFLEHMGVDMRNLD